MGRKSIKSVFLILSLFLFAHLPGFSTHVPLNRAKNVAINWMIKTSGLSRSEIAIVETIVEMDQGLPVYYVLNMSPAGFVIVSADDASHPILGYSLDRPYLQGNRPPAFDEWMTFRKSEIQAIIKSGVLPSTKAGNLWREFLVDPSAYAPAVSAMVETSVPPLLSTTWNQGCYYNEQCPLGLGGGGACGHVYVGCVATAMGQVMKKWNYPTTGTGSHSYTDPNYGLQSANFGTATYNWATMPNAITSSNFEIARLLYHCGVSVDMWYGTGGSAAYTIPDARNAYVTYFRYSRAAQYAYKDYSGGPKFPSDDAWDAMLRRELDNGRVVHYRGQSNAGGHSFVMDGYQNTDYFHFNWGWSGTSDGYYYLETLNPLMLFPTYQAAIYPIVPSNVMPEPSLHSVPVPTSISLGNSIELNIVSDNTAAASDDGRITVSFPNLTGAADAQYVELSSSSPGASYNEFASGQTIAHRLGYSVTAGYLMAEISHPSWSGGSQKFMVVRVTPQQTGTFQIYVRSTMGYQQACVSSPLSSAYTDQQGWEVTRYAVDVAAGTTLQVAPAEGLSSSGTAGGPFSPSSKSYTLQNSGGALINWTASKTQAWVTLSQAGGTLNGGQSTTLNVSINGNANGLAAGVYGDTVTITNTTNGSGNTTRAVGLAVGVPPTLGVTPGTTLAAFGIPGGPFYPSSQDYTLQNSGGGSLNWTAAKTQSWMTLSASAGTLAAGASTTVTVSLNANALLLSVGNYSDTVSFTNTTNGSGNTTRSVSLTVDYKQYITVRGSDNWIYSRSMNTSEGLSVWTKLNGRTDSAPATAIFNGRLYVVAKSDVDATIWWNSMTPNGVWGSWSPMDGFTTDKPSIAVFNGKLYIAIRGTDNKIYFRSMTTGETFSVWNFVPAGLTSVPPAIHAFNGMLYLAVKDSGDNKIWWNKMNTSDVWTGWNLMDGLSPSTAAMTVFNSLLYIAVRGSDNKIYYRSMSTADAFTAWSSIPGFTDSSPALEDYNGKLYMVVKSNVDMAIWWNSMTAAGVWGSFAPMDGLSPTTASLAAPIF